jgi:predicted amidophosphoribosyltransferase
MYDLVTPVPTHRDKQAVRGYNHADLMGKSFAGRAGLRYDPDVVVRTRPTLPMKGLGPEARIANIQGAFDIRAHRLPLIAGSRILLIDDIYTTGATIDEIASILKDAGASRIDFLAFAAAGDMIN